MQPIVQVTIFRTLHTPFGKASGCAMKNSNQIRVGLLPINIISYALFFNIILEEFEDTKGVIRIRKSKTN
jgi:hypothetical protein